MKKALLASFLMSALVFSTAFAMEKEDELNSTPKLPKQESRPRITYTKADMFTIRSSITEQAMLNFSSWFLNQLQKMDPDILANCGRC